MTIRLYNNDSYLTVFSSVITEITDDAIILRETAFFPEGGGQTSDKGMLGDCEIYDVQEKDGIIYHYTRTPHSYKVGDVVEGKIDFDKRFSDMQQHSGEHIVSGLVNKTFGYDNVGFHLGHDVVTLDFNGLFTKDDLTELERKANETVTANKKITVTFPSPDELESIAYRSKKEIDGEVRIVEIEDTDICACCAPHVRLTGEIGLIKIVGADKHRGGTRMSILCGQRAMEDYRIKQEQNHGVSVALKVKEYETADGVDRLLKKKAELEYEIGRLNLEIAKIHADMVKLEERIIIFKELNGSNLTAFADRLKEKATDFVAAFGYVDESNYQYVLCSNSIDVRPMCREMNSALNGRGGGKPQMVQGSIQANKEEIERFFGI